jgi:hypothetical protein
MDTKHLTTTGECQKAANELLDNFRYVYAKTIDIEEDRRVAVRDRHAYPHTQLNTLQVKRSGRYRGPLVVQTLAQCWIDFEGAIDVMGFVPCGGFPLAALVLSATAVSSF